MPVHTATFNAAFDFASRLRDPGFRELLQRHGWRSGQPVVPALDDELVSDVMARAALHDPGGQPLIAIPDDAEHHGFRFMTIGATPTELDSATRIGALYAALHP